MPTRDHPSDDPEIDSMADVGQWVDCTCPTCGTPARWRWTNLRAVARTGDEHLADKEYLPADPADLRRQRDELLAACKAQENAMDMQEKREKGEFHIPAHTAYHIWAAARQAARAAIANAIADATTQPKE